MGGCICGYVDGIIVVGFEGFGLVVFVFWECKMMNVKNWCVCVKDGVMKLKLVYVV